jgi:hypothetical protein
MYETLDKGFFETFQVSNNGTVFLKVKSVVDVYKITRFMSDFLLSQNQPYFEDFDLE